jgi:3'(2'), 5'-bisphosphate nucleotidase
MKEELIAVIREAGRIVSSYWGKSDWTLKEDHSPVTAADRASHEYLLRALREAAPLPVVSEEGDPGYAVRRTYERYWLIDPLDGTKGFIHGERDFCINIALIEGEAPLIGVIYAPLLEALYYAQQGENVSYLGPAVSSILPPRDKWRTTLSRYHHSEQTQCFLERNALHETLVVNSALKFGYLATGCAEVYPRFEGSKEWDIAAGHLVLTASGGTILDMQTHRPPLYNKSSIKNNAFVACRKGLRIEDFMLQEEARVV